jgi:hypothetical protein
LPARRAWLPCLPAALDRRGLQPPLATERLEALRTKELGLGLEDAPGSRIAMTLKIRITAATAGISLAIAIALLERFL